ncbi:nucleotide-diphospho-sugar transferase [Deinococcus irradiatisoli]|uniref:Nucleotide-diphospho-sugar transferase n=1 Tax=Deinococcus irradiatisoli TaxID=2202254 RepID=A0A2Z3JFC4_9DEIO|nr:NTP transferase domain-containing protein [Deinococcus irradiatisoli]AWN22050.1 nucleotide-diphospho-sugar transferase [Deinococcus irradiatisoli]
MTGERAEDWNAVVLGGGDPGDAFAAAHQVDVKPLIEVGGKPMGLWVLQALRDSGRVGRVAYVGPLTPAMDDLVDVRVTDRGTLLANLEAGVAALRGPGSAAPKRVMVVTADIPMLSGDQVRSVLDTAPEAGLVYPIVEKSACEAAYPGVKRTYGRLKDGTFTGGNLFLLDPALIHQFLPRLRSVLAARKQPIKLAGIVGPGILLKLVVGQLRLSELEARVSRILGVQARALITPHAAVGTDIDKEGDLALAERELGGPQA